MSDLSGEPAAPGQITPPLPRGFFHSSLHFLFVHAMARPLLVDEESHVNRSTNNRSVSHECQSKCSNGTTGSPRSSQYLARRSQVLWTVVFASVALFIKRLQQDSPALINPPYCAWRFVGNHDAWNVAFPDMRSLYHVMQIQMSKGDEFKLVAESFPYARYCSYQTYDLRTLMSHQSLRDVDIVPDANGPNCYANLTAAQEGLRQGGYTLYMTARGDQNYTNELRALPDSIESGQFDLFFRIYVEEALQGPPQAPWGHLPPYGKDLAFEWGWAPPPRLYAKRAHLKDGEWREVPFCQYRRRKGFKLLAYLSEIWPAPPPPFAGHPAVAPNKANNVFLPKYTDRQGKFASKDANYVASVAEPRHVRNGSEAMLWARVTGTLPRVPGSLYTPPYVANATDYDVRYVSLSAVHRTIPFRNHATVADTQITEHYQKRLPPGGEWDRKFTIWVVPPQVESAYPRQVMDENPVIMKWGASLFGGGIVEYTGLLYRQVMARSQVVGLEQGALSASGVVNIVPEACQSGQVGPHGEGADAAMKAGDPLEMEQFCCSTEAPMECFLPEYVRYRMGPYYPQVEYFTGGPEDAALTRLEH